MEAQLIRIDVTIYEFNQLKRALVSSAKRVRNKKNYTAKTITEFKKKLRRARIVNRIFQIFRLQGTGNVTEISHKIRLEKQKMQELDKRMACIQELLTTFKTK